MRTATQVLWAVALLACSEATLVVDNAGEDAGVTTGIDAARPADGEGGEPAPGADATATPPPPGADATVAPQPHGVDATLTPPPPGVDATVTPPPPGVDATVTPPPPPTEPPPPPTEPPPLPTEPPPPPVVQTIFNEPVDGSDFTAQNAMIDLLRQASPGSDVHIAIYEWDTLPYVEAVEVAVSRGVTVRVVADGNNMDPEVERRLVAAVGRGNVTLCGRGACIGTGINHNKFVLFSRLDDGSSNVVMQGSQNFRDSQNRRFNHLVVVRGDNALYTHYRDYWNDLRGQRQNLNYYDVHGDFTGDTGVKGYFFPRANGDLIISVLNNVHCDPGAELHVGMAFFKDDRGVTVAQKLREKRDAGCGVHLIVGDYLSDDPPSPSQGVQDALRGMDWRIFDRDGVTVHSKYLLIRARYAAGDEVETLVLAGSHNYTRGALESNDEALMRLNDAASYNAFLAHWNRMRAALP